MSSATAPGSWSVSRRDFLRASGLVGLGGMAAPVGAQALGKGVTLRFGIVTDAHYADADTNGSRYYRQSTAKLSECVERMSEEKVGFLVELGDFKDQGKPPVEARTLQFLRDIEHVFTTFDGPVYHVPGNHDFDSISKAQYLAAIRSTGVPRDRTYYSFDRKGVHAVVLDANFSADATPYDHGRFDWTDANIPSVELEWLSADLGATRLPTVVFVHQCLDGKGAVFVENAAAVRGVLEASGRVLAVFQGHHHAGGYNRINGIHYYTLRALVEGDGPENNSYATVAVHNDRSLTVTGHRKAVSRDLA